MATISKDHMREYETIYVLRPEVEDTVAVEFITKMKSLVEREGGKHLKLTNWGRKRIAWECDGNQRGMFVHHSYLGKPGLVKEYERNLKIEESCILRMTKVIDKRVVADTRTAEEDVLQPPAPKEERRPREDTRRARSDYDGGYNDRGDRGGRDDRGDRGGRDDRGPREDRGDRGGNDNDTDNDDS